MINFYELLKLIGEKDYNLVNYVRGRRDFAKFKGERCEENIFAYSQNNIFTIFIMKIRNYHTFIIFKNRILQNDSQQIQELFDYNLKEIVKLNEWKILDEDEFSIMQNKLIIEELKR